MKLKLLIILLIELKRTVVYASPTGRLKNIYFILRYNFLFIYRSFMTAWVTDRMTG
jgi:hypothetical protein